MRRILISRVLPVALLLLATACGTTLGKPASGPGGEQPSDAVERFLQSAAAPDYLEMGWVFGTNKGPIIQRDPPREVERRMYALATILENEGHTIRSQSPVPGRIGGAIQVDVALKQRGRDIVVPFTVVRGPGHRWFIEQIKLEVLTGR